MKTKPTTQKSAPPEVRPAAAKSDTFILRLYVAGQTPNSLAAFANLKKICEEHLAGRYQVEVIDLLQNPELINRLCGLEGCTTPFSKPQNRFSTLHSITTAFQPFWSR